MTALPVFGGSAVDGLVHALLTARRVAVVSLEHVVAMLLVRRATRLIVNLGVVGVLDVGAAKGVDPIADGERVAKRARVAEGKLLSADAYGIERSIDRLSGRIGDLDAFRPVKGHAIGQSIDHSDVIHRRALVVDEQPVADVRALGRIVHAYLRGVIALVRDGAEVQWVD